MLATLRANLFGEEGAAEALIDMKGLLGLGGKDESPADQFASWLPYISYLDEEQLFVNKDGMGFLLEVMPQSGADDRMVDVLVSLGLVEVVSDAYRLCHPFVESHARRMFGDLMSDLPELRTVPVRHAAVNGSRAAPPPQGCAVERIAPGRNDSSGTRRPLGAYVPGIGQWSAR